MNRSLEQALLSLLPTHNDDLPPRLRQLASSLLAQSRNRASSLKADEEVARLYACAHLACDRLKVQLDLPSIQPRPPIPPRIYKRLYTHLDKILPAVSTPGRANLSGNGTPASSRFRDAAIASGSTATTSRVTPSKQMALAQFRSGAGSKPNTPSKLSQVTRPGKVEGSEALYPWVRPALSFLCKEQDNKRLGPTIMAGLETIFLPEGRRTTDAWVKSHLSWVLGALFLYVWKSVVMPDGIDQERYVQTRREVVEALKQARQKVPVKGNTEEEEFWESWRDLGVKDLDTAALRINKHGWLEDEWTQGIDDLADILESKQTRQQGKNKASDAVGGPIRKADSMFQERFDYLSDKKSREYALWRAQMLAKIMDLEMNYDGSEMHVDG